MSDLFCKINLSDIDIADDRYKISFFDDDILFLALSIKHTGIIFPPVVRLLNHKYIIVSGFNRVRAHIFNNESAIQVRKLIIDKMSLREADCQCLLMSITALAFKRPLSHAELILSVRRLCEFLDEKQIAEKSSQIFNKELSLRFIKDLRTIDTIDDSVLTLIHQGRLSFKAARQIAGYHKQTALAFLSLFSQIKASNNKQSEIIRHIMEIAARDGIDPAYLINTKKIQGILFDDSKNPGMKTQSLRIQLFEQRFPELFKMNQDIMEKIKSIKLDPMVKILPPENFESRNYLISFKAKNHNEFVKGVKALNDKLDNKNLKKIFNL